MLLEKFTVADKLRQIRSSQENPQFFLQCAQTIKRSLPFQPIQYEMCIRYRHGLPGLKVADLGCNTKLLQEAKEAARKLLAEDPDLRACPATAERIQALFTQAADTLN